MGITQVQLRDQCCVCGGRGTVQHPLWKACNEWILRQNYRPDDALFWKSHGIDLGNRPESTTACVDCGGQGFVNLRWVDVVTLAALLATVKWLETTGAALEDLGNRVTELGLKTEDLEKRLIRTDHATCEIGRSLDRLKRTRKK